LQRYRQMLQDLQQRGIQLIVCLHHFTHLKWFERQGAFLGPNAVEIFERFARTVVGELGDLCRYWVTFNEPDVFAARWVMFWEKFPPGRKGEIGTSLRVVNAMAQCHAHAYRPIHELHYHALVGWAHNYGVFEPSNPWFAPVRRIAGLLSQLFNESFLAVVERGRPAFPFNLTNRNFRNAKETCDFVGLNVYSGFHVAFSLKHRSRLFGNVFVPEHVPQGDSGVEKPYGEAFPGAIRVAVRRAARLGKPSTS